MGHGALTNFTERRSGHLRPHGGGTVHAKRPVEGLIDEWHDAAAAATENKGRDRHALWVIVGGIDRWALTDRRRETRIRMRRLAPTVRRPVLLLPIDQMGGWLLGHSFPPDVAVVGQGNVGEDGVGADRLDGVGIAFVVGPRCHAEEPCLWVDGVNLAAVVGLDPGDIVAHRRHFPAFITERLGRDQHRKIRLTTRAGEGSRHIRLLSFRALHA